jgi:hypothetical protein
VTAVSAGAAVVEIAEVVTEEVEVEVAVTDVVYATQSVLE